MKKAGIPAFYHPARKQAWTLLTNRGLLAGALENVACRFVLLLCLGFYRLDEISFPIFGADFDLDRHRNPPLDKLAPLAPAIGRANIFKPPVLAWGPFVRRVHNSRSNPSESVF